MQAESDRADEQPAGIDLALLAERLVLQGMPVQRVIGEEAGVSQSTVSRAVHRKIRSQSAGARKLWRYAEERVRILQESPVLQVEAAPNLLPTNRRRASRQPRLAEGAPPASVVLNERERQSLGRRAMQGLRDYLEDRFDPQLVIEQLAVLRRAQDHAHLSRAMRNSSAKPRPR
ncbi:hypothetical protein [Sphingomonas sp. LHG3443-2]|uniref:hypothetical protein n=1 Tax=Sphingomonas sp. LHG3443-2 TaxID=2804639 RepID=UPI003CF34EB2